MELGIAFCGRSGTGKSTRAYELERIYPATCILSFASPIKRQFCEENNISLEYLEKNKAEYRRDLQLYAEEGRPDRWVGLFRSHLELCRRLDFKVFVVDDLRYENEAEYLKTQGFTIVRLRASESLTRARQEAKLGKSMSDEEWNDPSETDHLNITVDEEWDADGNPALQMRGWLFRSTLNLL